MAPSRFSGVLLLGLAACGHDYDSITSDLKPGERFATNTTFKFLLKESSGRTNNCTGDQGSLVQLCSDQGESPQTVNRQLTGTECEGGCHAEEVVAPSGYRAFEVTTTTPGTNTVRVHFDGADWSAPFEVAQPTRLLTALTRDVTPSGYDWKDQPDYVAREGEPFLLHTTLGDESGPLRYAAEEVSFSVQGEATLGKDLLGAPGVVEVDSNAESDATLIAQRGDFERRIVVHFSR